MIHLRHLALEVCGVALREAAGDHELLAAALLMSRHLEDGIDGLFFGGVDEPTSVDDDDVRLIRSRSWDVAGDPGHPEHDLGVDAVLGAAEGDEVDGLLDRS